LQVSAATRRVLLACLFALVLVSHRAWTRDDVLRPAISLDGTYQTVHPDEDFGPVLIRFTPTTGFVPYRGIDWPAFDVSVWKSTETGPRKVRNGLFENSTRAALAQDERGQLLLWYDPEDGEVSLNRITAVSRTGTLALGSADPSDKDTSTYKRLLRVTDQLPAESPASDLMLEGIYRYSHPTTGLVYVRFTRDTGAVPGDPSSGATGIDEYSVTVLARAGELGFSEVREGLYGGSFPDDSYTRVSVESEQNAQYLVWWNPAASGFRIRTAITTRYANGDIGISNITGEEPNAEDSVFVRVAEIDAPIGTFDELMDLPGTYSVALGNSLEEITVQISPHRARLDDPPGLSTHQISVIPVGSDENVQEAAFAGRVSGLFPGDPFTRVGLVTREGRGYLVWYSPEYGVTEENLVFDVDSDGSFLIVGGPFGARYVIARFTKVANGVVPLPDAAPDDGASPVRSGVREMLYEAARRYYGELPADDEAQWREFARWSRGRFLPARPENVDVDGYAGATGMVSPADDFAAFAVEYFMPLPYRDPMHHIRRRLPGRYAFFDRLFGAAPDAWEPPVEAPRMLDWIDPKDVSSIEIIVTTPTATAPESLAGHMLLLIRRYGDYPDGRDSVVIGFVGITSLDKANDVGAVTYAWRGIMGHYLSAIQEETLAGLVQRGTILEDRDVQRYQLELTREEEYRLIERLWVVKNTFNYEYRFFDQNCASMLLDTLNYAFLEGDVIEDRLIVPPLYVVAALREAGRLGDPIYPEYWSLGKAARAASAENKVLRKEILSLLSQFPQPPDSDPPVRRLAQSAFDRLDVAGFASVHLDELWRVPVLEGGDTGRPMAYEELAALYNLVARNVPNGAGSAATEECLRFADLLLRYFMNSFTRELYIAVPDRIREAAGEPRNIPGDIAEELAREQILAVQLRQENSPEIRSLRRATSAVRLAAERLDTESSLALIGRDMTAERMTSVASSRDRYSQTHGYFATSVSSLAVFDTAGSSVGAGADWALFSEEMGHKSLFTLKEDMRLGVLSAGVEAFVGLTGTTPEWGAGTNRVRLSGQVFNFDKVLVGSDVDYTGWFNHGFGFSLLGGFVSLADRPETWSHLESALRVLEVRYVLNLVERNGFTSYMNLSLGAAYGLEMHRSVPAQHVSAPVALEAKIHPGGNLENAVRFTAVYEPLLSFYGDLIHSAWASSELTWTARTNPFSTRSLGLGGHVRLEPDGIQIDSARVSVYLRLE